MLCLQCSKPTTRPKYCSPTCIKIAWRLRNNPPNESIYFGRPQKGVLWEEWFINRYGAVRPSLALNTPFDFWWNGERIDLKICELYRRKMNRGRPVKFSSGWWVFNRNSNDFDFALCIGLLNDVPQKIFKIPNNDFPASGATVSPIKSKYDRFIIDI